MKQAMSISMVHVRVEGGHVPQLSMMKYLVDLEGLPPFRSVQRWGFRAVEKGAPLVEKSRWNLRGV